MARTDSTAMHQFQHLLLKCLLLAAACAGAQAADPSSTPVAETRQAHIRQLRDQLAAEMKSAKDRTEAINQRLQVIPAELKELEPQGGAAQSPDQRRQAENLIAERSALQNELTFLQMATRSRQSAIDSQEMAIQFLQELELFKRRAAHSTVYYGAAEVRAIRAQLDQAKALIHTVEKLDAGRRDRLKDIDDQLAQGEKTKNTHVLQAERAAILAQIDATRETRESLTAQIAFFETKLSVASPSTAATNAQSRPATTGPAVDQKDAENKQRLADLLELEARGKRVEAQRQLKTIREEMARIAEKGGESSKLLELEDNLEYWQHQADYENRRLRQADSEKKIAAEKRQIAQLQTAIEEMNAALAGLQKTAGRYSTEERKDQAEEYREKAAQARKDAEEVSKRIDREQPGNDLWDALLHTTDALDDAIYERVQREYNWPHYYRMKELLDKERQQVNSLQNSWDVIKLAITNEGALYNKLASLYDRCANTLDPPEASFFHKNRKIFTSIWILLVAVAASYGLKFVIAAIQGLVRIIAARAPGRVSVKRAQTLLSFFASIIRIFIGIFAMVLILNAFDIDPAKSTAYIGLLSLVLAGMFQQIVVDFVKGFDIITGRHYNVGDFVELDGKTGHVIDFSVKHTRIRTASGQEYNLPNSKCIPSRRFPDGYVDNYVDISVRSLADIQRAKRAIAPVCRHLSRRVEQVKDEPIFVDQFPGTRPSSLILRYRVRVLPGSDWVVTDQFIPDVKAALAEEGVELTEEPTFFFINRIQVFRQLFSRELSEDEILQEAKEQQRPTVDRPESSDGSDLPAPKESDSEVPLGV